MSHITTSANFRFAWYVRLLFWLQRRRYGHELESARLWGRTPKAFLAMAVMYGALDRKSSPLSPALGGIGVAVATVPFIGRMLPSGRAKAAGAPVETDIRRRT